MRPGLLAARGTPPRGHAKTAARREGALRASAGFACRALRGHEHSRRARFFRWGPVRRDAAATHERREAPSLPGRLQHRDCHRSQSRGERERGSPLTRVSGEPRSSAGCLCVFARDGGLRMHAQYTLTECARFASALQITAPNSQTADACTLHAPRMRALRSRMGNHRSKLTSSKAESNALIRTDLSISTPPPATLLQIRTDQRRADRCAVSGTPSEHSSAWVRAVRRATNETRPKGSASGARPRGSSPNPNLSAESRINAIQRWPRTQRHPPVSSRSGQPQAQRRGQRAKHLQKPRSA